MRWCPFWWASGCGPSPRGVVLTRQLQFCGPDGEQQFQTWIRNASALPVVLTRVSYSGVTTYNDETGEIEDHDLPSWVPHEEEADLGISLRFDDEPLELGRDADEKPWRGLKVPPGDTLTAYVNLNRTLVLEYRRSGVFGVFERRTLRIDGGV